MIEMKDAPTTHATTASQCSVCGKSIRVNPLKVTDADVVCRNCRCTHCSIPLSGKACRCGVAHGSPSKVEGLCERCYVMTRSDRFEPSEMDDDIAVEYAFLPLLEAQRARYQNTLG